MRASANTAPVGSMHSNINDIHQLPCQVTILILLFFAPACPTFGVLAYLEISATYQIDVLS